MKIFVDANVIISAILFPTGKVATAFAHALELHDIIISSYTKNECIKVFENKFPDNIDQINNFFNVIKYESFTTPKKIEKEKYPKIRDEKDLPVIASAMLSDADILLTGDKDFEELLIDKPLILTPAKFLEQFS